MAVWPTIHSEFSKPHPRIGRDTAQAAQGKMAEARESVERISAGGTFDRDILQACLNPGQGPRLDTVAQKYEAAALAEADPERRYVGGAVLAHCGQKDAAFRLITSAVQQNYCAYAALQTDPLLAKLRGSPEFAELLAAAKQCQSSFLGERNLRTH